MRELRESVIRLDQVPEEGLSLKGAIAPARLARLGEVSGVEWPVEVDLHLVRESDVYLLTGRVTGGVALECEYCRAEFERAHPQELFLSIDPNPERAVYRDPSQKGEVWVMDHADEQVEAPEGWFDLITALEDEWLLALPHSPMCSEACKGLCPICGTDRNEAECGCVQPRRENPFDILAQLKTNE
ncbi:YceD family protein [Thiohalorhabdus sp.]|uniref:YceD family protein n=1 Tax=Thiohalorhabdus sp. TaxID=3094134 RepID=UPI002FC3772A